MMNIRVLFVGDLSGDGRGKQRKRAMEDIVQEVHGLSYYPENTSNPGEKDTPFSEKVLWKLGFPLSKNPINKMLLRAVKNHRPNILWIEKGNSIFPQTIKRVKRIVPDCQIVSHSEDDMFAFHNRSWYYTWGLRFYDVVFTTKKYNSRLGELSALGAKRVVYIDQAYDRYLHKPVHISEEDKIRFGSTVGFIGSYEKERAESLLYLSENGIKVRVWGNRWNRIYKLHPNLILERRPLYGEDYVKGICSTMINLCFLRKKNRDLHTSRTFEIPACRAFMIAERTEDHLRLFKEAHEAVYFDSNEELLRKVRYYLKHEKERESVACLGWKRCISSGYSFQERMEIMLKQIIS